MTSTTEQAIKWERITDGGFHDGGYRGVGTEFVLDRFGSKWAAWHDDHGLRWSEPFPKRTRSGHDPEQAGDNRYSTLSEAKAHIEGLIAADRASGRLTRADVKFVERGEAIDDCKTYDVVTREGGEVIGYVDSTRTDSYASDTTGSPYSYGYRGSPKYWSMRLVSKNGEFSRSGGYVHRSRKSATTDLVRAHNARLDKEAAS